MGGAKLIEHILDKNFDMAGKILNESLRKIVSKKATELKKKYSAKTYTSDVKLNEEDKIIDDIHEARVSIVKARIRGGKVQRRKKVSNVPGMTIRGGKLTRMSAAERRKRRMGAKRGKIKARAKKVQSARKRKLSMMKRSRLGI